MKIWLAGVPGGGSPGDCKRERAGRFLDYEASFILSSDSHKREDYEK